MKLSIVTVCFNAQDTIYRCINSIYCLDYKDYEYIIVDGKSTDRTLDIIRKFLPEFKKKNINVYLISEVDTGIYNAMNKAINIANGQWILFLNADDYFANSNCMNKFVQCSNSNCDVIYGDVIVNEDKAVRYQKANRLERLKSGTEMPFCHQSTFTRLSTIKKYRYNENYKIIADIDLYLRIYKDKGKFVYISDFISVFSNDGLSQTHRIESIREGKKMLKSHGLYTVERQAILNFFIIWYKIKEVLPKCIVKQISKIRKGNKSN